MATPTRADGTPEVRGRKRVLSVRTLLLATATAALDDREMHVVRFAEIIRSWTRPERRRLGIPNAEATQLDTITDGQVSDLWHAVMFELNDSAHFAPAPVRQMKARRRRLNLHADPNCSKGRWIGSSTPA